jgi:hypothetical protein
MRRAEERMTARKRTRGRSNIQRKTRLDFRSSASLKLALLGFRDALH